MYQLHLNVFTTSPTKDGRAGDGCLWERTNKGNQTLIMADTEDAIGRVKIGEEISDTNFMDGITTMAFADSLRGQFPNQCSTDPQN